METDRSSSCSGSSSAAAIAAAVTLKHAQFTGAVPWWDPDREGSDGDDGEYDTSTFNCTASLVYAHHILFQTESTVCLRASQGLTL